MIWVQQWKEASEEGQELESEEGAGGASQR
jgi:hypothetical protein